MYYVYRLSRGGKADNFSCAVVFVIALIYVLVEREIITCMIEVGTVHFSFGHAVL